MSRVAVMVACAAAVLASGALAHAGQQPAAASGADDLGLPIKIRVDQGNGIHFTKHLAVVFGGIKQGSSIAAGPAVSWEFGNGGYLQLKAGWSVKNFKLFQARYDSPPLFGGRSMISTRLRWQDAAQLPLYREGPDSPDVHLEFRATKAEWSAFLRTLVAPKTHVTVGSGVEGYTSRGLWTDVIELEDRLGARVSVPGIDTKPSFVHSFAGISYDTRYSPDYSRTGHLLDAWIRGYHNTNHGEQTFQRYELAAVQMIPTFKTSRDGVPPEVNYKGALALSARAWLSQVGEGRVVPFYLMPSLGGGDLRGYGSYRFHDRNALLLTAEYRYAVHKMIDAAVLLEGGTVAAAPTRLNLEKLAPSIAAGIRVHSKTSGLLRLDLARGRESFKFSIGVSFGS